MAPSWAADQCSNLRDILGESVAKAQKLWPPYPADFEIAAHSRWERDKKEWDLRNVIWNSPLPSIKVGRFFVPADSAMRHAPSDDEDDCTRLVSKAFNVKGTTIAFTTGHLPEQCSEPPRIVWIEAGGRQRAESLRPLYSHNVEALWCATPYLVFGLAAEYEDGSRSQAIAFWNLETGTIHVLQEKAVDDDSEVVQANLDVELPGWMSGSFGTFPQGVGLRTKQKTLIFLPEKRRWTSQGN